MTADKVEAVHFLTDCWGSKVVLGIMLALPKHPREMPFKEFLTHCTPCGGDWGGLLLSGMHEIYPTVWEAIPDHMGIFAWSCICEVLNLCGVQREGED